MVKNRIIVSDANIFIDLLQVELLEAFFALTFSDCEIWTTDFVYREVKKVGKVHVLEKFKKNGKLKVASFNSTELGEIIGLKNSSANNTSVADASVWYYAKKTGGVLLTGDKKLRKESTKDGIRVSGIIYVWELMLANNIFSQTEAADNLEALMDENPRLPRQICEQKISAWRSA